VVLGCRVRLDGRGKLGAGVLRSRVETAAGAYGQRARVGTVVVVASGGRTWGGSREAEVIAHELAARGVPRHVIAIETRSLTTRDNARFSAQILAGRGIDRAWVVTSDWHLARAVALFRRAGIWAVGIGAPPERDVPLAERVWRGGRERVLTWLQSRRPP
jgi:uncharacterized SAM-binding protein YcdF (DUF218 family)